jgi:G3E family GTPase
MSKVPVTIITGFLGSGKTTLLNNFIKKYPGKKFAVIENEFGETGIDSQLINGKLNGIFELANGCICCTLNEDFYMTLSTLMESEFSFDHLLVETTGIADPLSVVRLFLSNEEIQEHFKIDGVICVADVTILEELIEEMPEIRKQIAVADIILLNKADLSSKMYLDEAMRILQDVNPVAKKFVTAFSDIHDLQLLDADSYSARSTEYSLKSFFSAMPVGGKRAGLMKSSSVNEHHTDFFSESFVIDQAFRFEAFGIWMRNYLYFNERTILRAKGILYFQGMPNKYIFHAVFGSYILEEGSEWADESAQSKLVFIGRYMDRDEIEAGLLQLATEEQ